MSPVDPRPAAIARRLAPVARLLAVTGGKGGIGKSFVAATLALALRGRGSRVGLFDLDLTGPCAHLLLGVGPGFPEESFGVDPLDASGVRFMSVALFAGERPAPLRGGDVTNALVELLAVTNWPPLDWLVLDMPPGLGDASLDTARLLPRAEYLAVTTGSRMVLETVARTLTFHRELGTRVLGVVENMAREDGAGVAELAGRFDLPLLGRIPWDPAVEEAFGRPARLLATSAGSAVSEVAARLDTPGTRDPRR